MVVKGNSVTFNGNGHQLKGNGDQYWVCAPCLERISEYMLTDFSGRSRW
jgi:hypothetical protein